MLQETNQPSLVDRVEVGPDIRIENEIHLLGGDSDDECIQRIVLAALRSKPVREPEEVFLVDRVQDSGGRPLDDLVLKGGNCEGALPSVRFGDVDPSGWQGPNAPL